MTLISVEVATRLLDVVSPTLPHSWLELVKASPPPYKDADYDVALLLSERIHLDWTAGDDYGYRHKDTQGTYINIVDSKRVTVGAPDQPKNRVWVFGGSTIICVEVPDRYTVPSQIQAILNKNNTSSYEVINLGATSLTSKHQLWRLLNDTRGIKKGDIVVFFDGVNDVVQSLYYKNPTGTMIGENRQQIDKSPFIQKIVFYLYGKFSNHSAFVRRFLYPFNPEVRNVSIPVELAAQLKLSYIKNIEAAADFAKKNEAAFFHFVQPSLYSVSSLTSWEDQLLSNPWLYPKELKNVYAVGYPSLREASAILEEHGVASFDISNALDGRQSEIFFDYVHVNQKGNELIAQAIVTHIWTH